MRLRLTRNLGMLLLGIWLLLTGLLPFLNLGFSGMREIMSILALAAGAAILAGR